MTDDSQQTERRPGTKTTSFGASNRENHDASAFYARSLGAVEESEDTLLNDAPEIDQIFTYTAEDMHELPSNCVALMVTSLPYHVGKDYDSDATFEEYLAILDPFIGSGSTAVAAVQAGRHYVGYETNPEYVAIAERRIAEAKAPA